MKVTWGHQNVVEIDDKEVLECGTVEKAMLLVGKRLAGDVVITPVSWDYEKALAEVKAVIVKAKAEELLE
jgi:hypothetical protein